MSTPHLAMKFPSTDGEIVTVHIDQKVTRECYVTSLKVEPTRRLYSASLRGHSRERRERSTENRSQSKAQKYMIALVDLNPWLDDALMEVGEDLQPLPLNDDEHKTYIGSSLNPNNHRTISRTLVDNVDLVENEALMSSNL